MIVSFFPDHIWGGCTTKRSHRQKNLCYHRIIYAFIRDKYSQNRKLRKSYFALFYISYVFIKMLPMTLAIENNTEAKSITAINARSRTLPEVVSPHLEEDDDYYVDEESDEYDIVKNKSAKGMYIGAPCEFTCHAKLHHVYCDPSTNTCSCEKDYVVLVGLLKGCAKPKKLGEQCFYEQTCLYNDANSLCVQIKHNAICQCAPGFHSVSYSRPTKRVFCTQDMAAITADLPTLFGVTSGIAVLAGLICMVLHLFSKTKYPRPRHFGDANLAPPILYNSDTGSRRPSLASIHSTTSSVRSYSMRRFEQEVQQKELRQEMKKHLVRLQEQQQMQKIKPNIIIGDVISCPMNKPILTTPSPLTPNSIDDLLPSVDETQEFSPNHSQRSVNDSMCGGYDGPCSSTELLKQ
ncbi:uncharacterized protein LOC129767661 isoform X3 [Toxorhynchites rutilus septentrionalis]|uniref:uncharacterized protein LOC129767661 isoform X3 n=1 Tax=Toxorhynchites rutilus septentrionalis TaxID=329112 RepID=UPI00247ADB16|nr:uncharacterized protein LOC129767661 isoform X3 [Toxorhynchites rutilus septentrionalis]